MHVRLLGPLRLHDGSSVVAVGGVRQRAVLAYLALRSGDAVPAERIVVDLWGEDAPSSATNALQQTVSRLRRLLPDGRLVTTTGGYLLRLQPAELDVAEFTARVARGRALHDSGDAAAAAAELRAALALWHGEALADFRYEPFAQPEIARLDELRLSCLEERFAAELAVGPGPDVVDGLSRVVEAHPARERAVGLLMRALYGQGRQTDALDVFRALRRTLADELGLEPSPALVDLERRILGHDVEPAGPSGPATTAVVPGPPRASRRLVTALCAQVLPSGEDDADDALDAEAWDVLVGRATGAMSRAVARHGGAVAAVVGTQVVAVFGVESVHEDDAVRAVAAAFAGSVDDGPATTGSGAAGSGSAGDGGPTVRCGVASGEAVVSGTDASAVGGNVVARAVELARAAPLGGVVVDRRTHDLAGAAVAVDAGPDGRLVVRAVRPGARPLPVLTRTPFVGRDAELRRLQAALGRVTTDGAPGALVVAGEAGVGKTRLLHELAAAAPGVRVLQGRCPPYGETVAFRPLRDLVLGAGAASARAADLEALLGPAPDAAAVADVLAEVLGPSGDRRTEVTLTAWAVRRLLERLAASGPLVVVLDDVHWAHDSLLEVAEQVVDTPPAGPVLLVAICRPELLDRRPGWRRTLGTEGLLELPVLAPDAVAQLLRSLSAGRGLPVQAAGEVLDAAGGNPLFLEQLVAWQSERPDRRESGVPPTLAALVSARLDLLGPAERDVLDVAAVLGRDVDAAAVVALVPDRDERTTARHLSAIAARGLLVRHDASRPDGAGRPDGGRQDARHAFRHALLHQVAYRSVPRPVRARLHAAAAEWLERAGHDDPSLDVTHDVVGFHLERSVRLRRELGGDGATGAAGAAGPSLPGLDPVDEVAEHAGWHLEKAAARAGDVGDPVHAATLLRRAVDVLPADHPDRARPLAALGAALTEAGRFDDAAAVLDEATSTAASATTSTGRLWAAHARVRNLELLFRTEMSKAVAAIEAEAPELLDVFERHEDDRGAAAVWQLTASMHWAASENHRAEQAWDRALVLARRSGSRADVAGVLRWLASVALWGPRPAVEGIERCESYLEELVDLPLDRAVVQLHLAPLYAMQGDVLRSRALVRAALEVYDAVGGSVTTAVREPAAYAAYLEGDLTLAEEYLRHEHDFLGAVGDTSFRAGVSAQLADLVAHDPTRLAEAEELLAAAEEAADPLDLSAKVFIAVASARILVARGRADEAVRFAQQAVSAVRDTDLASLHTVTLDALADALGAAGRSAESDSVSRAALAAHLRKGDVVGAVRTQARLARATAPTPQDGTGAAAGRDLDEPAHRRR